MTADFRFIAHAAKRHTNVFPSGRFGDGLTQRGFTYPGGPTRQRIGPDFCSPGSAPRDIQGCDPSRAPGHSDRYRGSPGPDAGLFDLTARIPRHLHHPVDVATHDGRFRRHRRHHLQLLQFRFGFSFASFGIFAASILRFSASFSSGASSISPSSF